ncbi:hypothetical protein CO230_06820 [Chryseobacterium sp. 6424]|uniref:T9SS type B sorting domain-containing protein n=1 Tax=Chryseobacterium sp. 6424 TaxID=2039166 RepID=UPI000EFBE343|nr:T9SS type B sorting domain-containing protein [Chryseobacterium sp. 6424]AYO57861.1 hypothetical protein CO230_06820 [Chryseobacterium sp. 6424]
MRRIYVLFLLFLGIYNTAQTIDLYHPTTEILYPSQQYFCVGESLDFKVNAESTSTGDYRISSEAASTFPLVAGNIPINFQSAGADKFSEAFPIGFTFSFYEKNYTKAVLGSNGRLVFTNDAELEDLKDINVYKDRTFSGITGYNDYSRLPSTDYNKVYRNAPERELNLAQIFFGYTDLVPKSTKSSVDYFYKNISVNGKNALLISFQNQIRTNGTGDDSSAPYNSFVLLIEGGEIIIEVRNKTQNSYNAILGIQNENATKFKVPTHNYNNGPWRSEGVAWVFTPNQNLTPQFKWFRNGTQIPGETSDTVNNFEPNDGDVLMVVVTYHDPSGAQVGAAVSDEVKFKLLQNPQISAPTYTAGCGNPAELHVISPDPNLIYEWRSDTDASFSQTGTSILVGNGSYYVQVKNTAGTCTLRSASQVVDISSILPTFVHDGLTIRICDKSGQPSQIFDLAAVTGYPPGADYTVEYFETGTSAPITSASILSGQTKNFTIKVSTNAGVSPACTFTKNFSIAYQSFPPDNTVYTSAKICDNVNSYTVPQFKAEFFAGSPFQFEFSTDGTTFNTTPVNPQTHSSIWVKITDPNFTCQSIVKLNFDFHPTVEIKPFSTFPPHCFSTTEYFDLNITKAELEYSSEILATFYRNIELTDQITDLNYRGSGTIYIKVENIVTGCVADSVPTLQLRIYRKPSLIKTTPETKFSICGTKIYNLTTVIEDYIGTWSEYPEIRYFDASNIALSQVEWESYDAGVRGRPYMVFVYNQTNNLECSDRIEFNLIELTKPVALISQIAVCGETTYALQNFKRKAIVNEPQYTFTDEFGNPLPSNFDLTILPLTVRFYMKNNSTGCTSDFQSITFVQGSPTALISTQTDYELCDEDFDGKTTFNLDTLKTKFISDASAVFEYFKDSGFTVTIPSTYINETAFAQTVYVRITSGGQCPSTAKINLKVNTPVKSGTLLDKYFICYGETLAIDAGAENTVFSWSDGKTGQIAYFTQSGSYSVVLKNGADGCPYTHNFVISDENQPKIEVVNQTSNAIEVIATGGAKPYRYYFNGIMQTSNILQNPTELNYEIQVQSAMGCLGPPKTVYFIKISNSFSPNGDGRNDVWKVENLDKMERVSIQIVDRYGNRVFASGDTKTVAWDGTMSGKALPSSTYWYTLSWYDPITQKTTQRQGWILLKNRD